jgi:hypothetical protein
VTGSANASDNIGVIGVQFKVDGVNVGAEVTSSPYSVTCNTTTASNSTHSVTAVARDAAGNATTSAPVVVTVFNPDTTPPTVSMSAPAAGAIVAGNAVPVSATASDNNGVVGVQFLLDGVALGAELTTAPYTMSWNTTSVPNGSHALSARARDAAGNTATSAARTVSVTNGTPLVDVTVFTDRSNAATTIASPAFSTTSGNELLLAFIAADDLSANQTVSNVTGAALTWTMVKRTNGVRGDAEIWRAFATAPLTNAAVTATLAQSAAASMTVVTFTGVDTTGTNGSGAIGATGTGSAASGAPTASLVTTRANSVVFGVGSDWDSATNRTVPAGQTMVHQYLATVGDTFWVQRVNNPTATVGATARINDTAPTADR